MNRYMRSDVRGCKIYMGNLIGKKKKDFTRYLKIGKSSGVHVHVGSVERNTS